jgi:hypothetical protein
MARQGEWGGEPELLMSPRSRREIWGTLRGLVNHRKTKVNHWKNGVCDWNLMVVKWN